MSIISETKYSFGDYIGLDRWASFYYQLKLILALAPATMLEIGKGSGVLADYLKNHTKVGYQSLDSNPVLQPDLVGDVRQIPAADQSFDLVAAFEVLEHLPFDQFERALAELRRVAKRYVVISLPDSRPHLRFSLKIPLLPRWQVAFKFSLARRAKLAPTGPESHWWEIGWPGYSARQIKAVLKKFFAVRQEFVPFENQYHHFYLLEQND